MKTTRGNIFLFQILLNDSNTLKYRWIIVQQNGQQVNLTKTDIKKNSYSIVCSSVVFSFEIFCDNPS